jgi:hypothetical protein
MKRSMMSCLCLLFAVTAHAAGITSFEPDTARVQPPREPMVDTPIWLGSSWTVSSMYRTEADGLWNGPMNFAGFGFGATWPWKSRRQGYAEWHYGARHIRHEVPSTIFVGGILVPSTYVYTERVGLFAIRGGIEQRFGRRRTPWCTAGGGVGFALNAADDPAAAFELTARTAVFTYPTENTRVGLMLSAGPTWSDRAGTLHYASLGEESTLRTHFDLTLRLERRLRFPKSVADAEQ